MQSDSGRPTGTGSEADAQPPGRPDMGELLRAYAGGDSDRLDALFEHLYRDLRGLAQRVRAGRASETLNTTALVHEAYVKLVPSAGMDWESRAHFLGVAARAMRQVLVDVARGRAREKRGGPNAIPVTLDESQVGPSARPYEVLALDAALDELALMDARQAKVVEQRFFAGMTAAETAAVLGISEATANRDWRIARAWLRTQLDARQSPS